MALLALAGGGLVLAGEAPQRGMTQAQVRAQFGTPVDTRGPVGQPPISRWVYPDYTVYFENQVVLHSVTRPLNETADNARPANDAGDTEDRHPGDGAGNAEPSPPPPRCRTRAGRRHPIDGTARRYRQRGGGRR
ncbi:hypothetical protein A3Q32_02105 [Alcanivorax sp. KX64203]|nr:hypothetical protein A3Q32_02105 [Alcanivorax sp. KX64203]